MNVGVSALNKLFIGSDKLPLAKIIASGTVIGSVRIAIPLCLLLMSPPLSCLGRATLSRNSILPYLQYIKKKVFNPDGLNTR